MGGSARIAKRTWSLCRLPKTWRPPTTPPPGSRTTILNVGSEEHQRHENYDPVLQIMFIVGILQVRLDAQQEQLQSMGALVETLSAGRPVNMFFAKNVKWCVDLCVRVASDMCVVVLVHS